MPLVVRYAGKEWDNASAAVLALDKRLKGSAEAMTRTIKAELLAYLQHVAENLAQRHGGSYPGGTSASTLSRRSGAAVRSIRRSVAVSGGTVGEIVGRIGGVHHLVAHEFGATVKAKNGGWLTIPLPAALNANGTPKKPRARDWPNTFIIKSKKGNLLIVQKKGRGILPLYVLKKSVRIPARLGMGDELTKALPLFLNRLRRRVKKEFGA